MRDIIVTIFVLIGLGYALWRPYMGILLWSWLGYMNPHRLCYGFAYSMPFAQITAIVTVVSMLFSNERKSIPRNIIVYLLLLIIAWMGVTTLFAFHSEVANTQYIKIIKIQLPIILTLMLINTKERVHQLLWVITFSLAFFSIKGGIFTLLTAGAHRVYGPVGFVQENNALAVATLMVIPLMLYLRSQVLNKWLKHIMLIFTILMGISVLGSQSRGAFLAIMLVGLYYWLLSDKKIVSGLLIVVFIGALASVLPDSWYERMDTIGKYEQDGSAMGRIHAWHLAYNVANKNLVGGGLVMWSDETYVSYLEGYNPEVDSPHVAHSIYFSVLGEHGWIGLFLFLLIFYLGWRQCTDLVKQYDKIEPIQWVADLAKMLKIGLLAYLAGGAFLSLAYFDLPWHFLAIIVILKEIAHNIEIKSDDLTEKQQAENKSTTVTLSDHGYIQ